MKTLGIGSMITGLLMLLAGMSGDFTQQYVHDTILMIFGGLFGLTGVGLLAWKLAERSEGT